MAQLPLEARVAQQAEVRPLARVDTHNSALPAAAPDAGGMSLHCIVGPDAAGWYKNSDKRESGDHAQRSAPCRIAPRPCLR